jgi:hypothetical protein
MSHFQLVGGGNKFTAVPKAACGLNGAQVSISCNGKYNPAGDVIYSPIRVHVGWVN